MMINISKYTWWSKLSYVCRHHIQDVLELDDKQLQKLIPTTITTAQEQSRLSIGGFHYRLSRKPNNKEKLPALIQKKNKEKEENKAAQK